MSPAPCNNVVGSTNLFSDEVAYANYGYEPSHAGTYAFLAIYAAGFVAQVIVAVWHNCWWALPTLAVGAMVETLGWAGRAWSIATWEWSPNRGGLWMTDFNSFIMQICCLVIGPTFFSAANYILLGKLIANTGSGVYSSLHPKSFSILFICADVACLLVQAAGGGIAGTANTHAGSDNGAYIMTAGVVLQLVLTAAYIVLFGEWLWRRKTGRPATRQYHPFSRGSSRRRGSANSEEIPMASPAAYASPSKIERGPVPMAPSQIVTDRQANLMSCLITAGTLLIVIRSVYRSTELANGWSGPIAVNEPLFLGMDALLMALFVWLYVVVHPGMVFGKRHQ